MSKLFTALELAFNPAFYYRLAAVDMDNRPYDIRREAWQRQLGEELLTLRPHLAQRYADVLREVKKPAGLADVEKRTAFLKTVEDAQGKPVKTATAPGPMTDTATRFKMLDRDWKQIIVDGQLFDLQDRKQIKKALRFLHEKGYTSTTGKRATVKTVCREAGQKSQQPNLHAIFHVMKQPVPPTLDYDHLYDLAIDCQRGSGVLLKV